MFGAHTWTFCRHPSTSHFRPRQHPEKTISPFSPMSYMGEPICMCVLLSVSLHVVQSSRLRVAQVVQDVVPFAWPSSDPAKHLIYILVWPFVFTYHLYIVGLCSPIIFILLAEEITRALHCCSMPRATAVSVALLVLLLGQTVDSRSV